jgi:hypothetical protein
MQESESTSIQSKQGFCQCPGDRPVLCQSGLKSALEVNGVEIVPPLYLDQKAQPDTEAAFTKPGEFCIEVEEFAGSLR